MKAITIFTRCRAAEGDMRRIRQRIQQRREAAASVAPQGTGIGGGHGTSEPDKMSAFVAAIDELESELKAREQARSVEVAAACVLLDALPEMESAVLHRFYIRGHKVPGIAKKLGFSEGYIRKLKAEAERLLDSISEETVVISLPVWYLREHPEE